MGNYRFQIPKNSLPIIEKFVKENYPKAFKNYLHRYFYVVDYISRGTSYYRNQIPMSRDMLSDVLGTNGLATNKIILDLCILKVIKKCTEAIPKIKSSKYTIIDKSTLAYSIPVNIYSSKAVMNIIKKRNISKAKQVDFQSSEGTLLLLEYISQINIDSSIIKDVVNYPLYPFLFYPPNTGEFEKEDILEFKLEYGNLIRIYHGNLYIKRPIFGSRVYTPFSVMAREHRKYLSYEGERLKCVDIVNSQPLISAAFFRKYCSENKIKLSSEINAYQESCEKGLFYEQFMDKKDREPDNRTNFKKDFFGSVFFTRVSKKKNRLRSKFKTMYPEIHDLLDRIKTQYGNDGFAHQMQKLEASIIWDDVNVSMLKDGYLCYNIYDSIVSHDYEVLEVAKTRIIESFKRHGVTPSIKLENFSSY